MICEVNPIKEKGQGEGKGVKQINMETIKREKIKMEKLNEKSNGY